VLHKSAIDAFRSYMQGYAQHPLKHVFSVNDLDLVKVAKSFGMSVPPRVHLKVSLKAASRARKEARKAEAGSGLEDMDQREVQARRPQDVRQWSR
jgi:ATP-dependent RNA helicase DDX18/HAS1